MSATIPTTVDWLESRVPAAQAFAATLPIPAENPPGNFEPIADAGAPVQATAKNTVHLAGPNSLDLDGTIVSYFWTQTSGQPATLNAASTAQPSVEVPLAATALEFELTVTDDDGASTNDRVEIDVTENAQLPGSSSSIDLLTVLTLLLTICLVHRKRASARLSQGKS